MSLVVVLGGARSGKSALAVELAGEQATFVATGTPGDEEMATRIERHRAERPAGWSTVEEPLELRRALAAVAPDEAVVVDCLSLWVSNLIEVGWSDDAIEEEAAVVASVAAARPGADDRSVERSGPGNRAGYPARPALSGRPRPRQRAVGGRRRPRCPRCRREIA